MLNSATDITLQALKVALDGDIKGDQVLARGPGHKSIYDRSLSVKPDASKPDGFIVHSFAGDPWDICRDYVLNSLGLPPFNGHKRPDPPPRSPPAASSSSAKPKIVATYDYRDADGTLLYQVLRYDPKAFRQRAADGTYKLDGVKRVLYKLPELIADSAAFIFLTEGEKDADRVATLGLCSTTLSGGSKWTAEIVEPLRGRDVVVLPDADEAGAKKACAAATALHGIVNSVRVVRLPGLLGKPGSKDVSNWLDYDPRRADILATTCLASPLWTPEAEAVKPAADKPDEPLAFIDMSHWDTEPAPPRLWSVRDRIPLRQPALLSGEGSVGKTLLMLQLSAAHVLGRDWLGMLPEPGPAIYFGCEDDADEIHRRVADIAKHYHVSFADLVAGGLHLLSFAGMDAVLGAANRAGVTEPTPLFHRIHKATCAIKPKTLVIDTSADAFAGSENDRMQVRQFVGLLRRLAIDGNCSVLLCSHPSLTGISTGTGLSGSTGWHNSVRARMFFRTAATDQGEEPDPELRELVFLKNNYGPIGARVLLRWKNGVFMPEPGQGTLEKAAAERKAEELFLTLLGRFSSQGRNVSDKPTARNYAPVVFSKEAEARKDGTRKSDFESAMRRVFAADKIAVQCYGPASRGWSRMVTR